MAYGIKYTYEWCALDSVNIRYDILKRDYTGLVTEVQGNGDAPFILKKLNDKGKKGTIITTEAVIEIYETNGFDVDDIYTTDEREYQLRFYVDEVLEWVGYLLPDYFSKEINLYPSVVLSAVDQLGSLKDAPFSEYNGSPYIGRSSLFSVISLCLERTGIDLPINDIVNIESTNWTPVAGRDLDILNDTFIDLTRFHDEKGNFVSCYDVLETTLNLMNARIFIQGGKWWITNKRQIELKTGSISQRTNTGEVTSKVIAPSENVEFDFIHQGGTQLIEGADNITTVYSQHGNFLEQIENQLFLNRILNVYSNWTKFNGMDFASSMVQPDIYGPYPNTPVIASSPLDPPKPQVGQRAPMLSVSSYLPNYNAAPYIQSDPIYIKPDFGVESMQLSLSLRGYPGSSLIVMVIGRLVSDPSKTFAVTRQGEWSDLKGSNNIHQYIPFTLPVPENTGSPVSTVLGKQAVENNNMSLNIGKFSSVLGLTYAPEEYYVQVRVYGVMPPNGYLYPNSMPMTILKRVSLDLISPDSPKGIAYSMLNNRAFTKESKALNTLFSDKVVKGVNGDFTLVARDLNSTIYNRGKELTEAWTSPVTSGSDFINMLATKQIHAAHAIPHKILQVTLDEIDIDINRIYSPNCSDEQYMVNSIEVHYKADHSKGYTQIEFAQVVDVPVNSVPKISTSFEEDDGSNIKGVGTIKGGGGSGGGGSSQDLQSVTDIGADSTNIITVKGTRNQSLLSIPSDEPITADIISGEEYIHFGEFGQGSPSAPSGAQELRELDDVDNNLNPSSPSSAGDNPTFLAWNNQTNKWTARQGSYIPMSQKGSPNGVATLGTDGILSTPQRPASDLEWDLIEW